MADAFSSDVSESERLGWETSQGPYWPGGFVRIDRNQSRLRLPCRKTITPWTNSDIFTIISLPKQHGDAPGDGGVYELRKARTDAKLPDIPDHFRDLPETPLCTRK